MRDYKDPEYQRCRAIVRSRDHYRCQMSGCSETKKLQVHHILPWSKFPHLRYEVDNMITLCKACHKRVRGHEILFAPMFREIVKSNGKR